MHDPLRLIDNPEVDPESHPDGKLLREALSPHGLSRKARRRAIRSLPRTARKELQRQRESGVKPNGSKSA